MTQPGQRSPRTVLFLFVALTWLACAMTGCTRGGPPAPTFIRALGWVLRDGKAPVLGSGERLTLSFFAEDGPVPGAMHSATMEPDGTFEVAGTRGNGIPAGKYRISAALLAVDAAGRATDKLGQAFAPANTPLVRDIDSEEEIVVDLTIGSRR